MFIADSVQICELCQQVLNDIKQIQHMEDCHKDGKHKCITCKKEFSEIKILKRHLKVHK